jgi:acetolactate synthase-1/2/3 large subunit
LDLDASLDSLAWKGSASWLSTCTQRRDDHRKAVERRAREQADGGSHAIDIIRALEPVLGDEGILLIDGGSIGQWAHQLLCSDRYPSHWLTCGRSGVVGWGIGGAMAARLAYPNRPVILLSGDGSFTFNVGDLESAVRQELPFVAIVADDEAWGITRTGHMQQFGTAVSSSLGPIAFDRLAESLGAQGVRAEGESQIRNAICGAMNSGTLTVLHVPIAGGNPG